MRLGVRFEYDEHLAQLTEIQQKTLYGCLVYGKAAAMKMTKEAKIHRPWEDRTHLAKNSISGGADAAAGLHKITIHLSLGMNYGVYLENKRFRHKGRLAIIFPTVKKMAPEVLSGWVGIVKRGGG